MAMLVSYWVEEYLALHTRRTYPRDGTQVVFCLVSICLDVLAMTSLIEPQRMDWMARLALAQGVVLCVRLFIDMRQMTI